MRLSVSLSVLAACSVLSLGRTSGYGSTVTSSNFDLSARVAVDMVASPRATLSRSLAGLTELEVFLDGVSTQVLLTDPETVDLLGEILGDQVQPAAVRTAALQRLQLAYGAPLVPFEPLRVGALLEKAIAGGDVWLLDVVSTHLFADLEVPGFDVSPALRKAGLSVAALRAGREVGELLAEAASFFVEVLKLSSAPLPPPACWIRVVGWAAPELFSELASVLAEPEARDLLRRARRFLPV